MKTKVIITLLGLIGFSFLSSATEVTRIIPSIAAGGEKCFDENTKIINIGVGFGGVSYYKINKAYGYSYGRTPAFSATYEQAIKPKLGIGYLGVGAYVGYQHERYSYDDWYYKGNRYYYEHNWNHFMIAARAAYHFDVLNSEKAEVYVGAIIGLRFQTYNYTSNHPDPQFYNQYKYSTNYVYPSYSLFAGARWYFAKNVGLFGEVGYGISFLTGGFSFKF